MKSKHISPRTVFSVLVDELAYWTKYTVLCF